MDLIFPYKAVYFPDGGIHGMLKVTIAFPHGATVTLETTEPHMYREVISSTRDYLSLDAAPSQNGQESPAASTNGIPPTSNGSVSSDQQFLEFCQKLATVGDMRRVVAAAEGARQFLGMDQVSTQELGALFDFVQWPKPRNFLQTLRNAGRSNFRWLQRVPGSSGYYSVTDQGRREIISEDPEQTL